MALWALQMEGDNAVLPWEGTDIAKGIPPGTLACTEAQYREFSTKLAVFAGSAIWRWEYKNNVLTELPDPRPAVTWEIFPGSGDEVDPDGNIIIQVDEGFPTSKVCLIHELGNGYQQTDIAKIGNKLVKLVFVQGKATININADVNRRVTYESSDLYAMTNTVTLNVVALKL